MAPVDLVTIHHEGSLANGGAPTDQVDRCREGGYTCGLGETLFERWRAPADAYATLNFNGEDWCPVYTGDHHTGTHLRDRDIELLHDAYMDAFNRGEVTAAPLVRAHRNSPGSATACPGDFTIARWAEVEAACRPGTQPPDNEPVGGKDDMVPISVEKEGRPANEQPYGFLDATARKVWVYWDLKVNWDGGGDDKRKGAAAPYWFDVPGSAPLVGWELVERIDNGRGARVCAFGINGAEYWATLSG